MLQDDSTSYESEPLYNYLENREAWTAFGAQLDRLAAIAEREGICVVVFLNPHPAQLDSEHLFMPVYARVAEALSDRGLFPVGSIEAFLGLADLPL